MVKTAMKRDIQGKFVLKNDEYRSVRSLRLTDSTWEALGVRAESLGITRGDLLEQMVRDNDYGFQSNTWMEATALPSNTWKNNAAQPSNTRKEEEEEKKCLLAQVQRLSQENALLVERNQENSLVPSLEALRDRILSNLKLGKQAPGYKAAQKALNHFISELTHPDPGVF